MEEICNPDTSDYTSVQKSTSLLCVSTKKSAEPAERQSWLFYSPLFIFRILKQKFPTFSIASTELKTFESEKISANYLELNIYTKCSTKKGTLLQSFTKGSIVNVVKKSMIKLLEFQIPSRGRCYICIYS